MNLFANFMKTATEIGKIIIDERDFPSEKRKYPSNNYGGRAGGEKYKHAGIFFKFAIDQEGMYGGCCFFLFSFLLNTIKILFI